MVKNKEHYLWAVLLGVLTLVAAYLRFWGIDSISLDVDEAITLSAAQGLVETGRPIIQASGLYYGRDILGTLTTASSIFLFGTSEWAARLPMVLFGILTIPLVYLLGRKLSVSKIWSLLAATGVTFSQWGIYYAHSARMYQEQQFFVLLAALATVWTLQRWSVGRALVSVGVGVLAVLAHRSAVIILPVMLGLFIWNRRSQLKAWLNPVKHRMFLGLGVILVLVLLILAEWQFGLVSGMWHYVVGTDRNPFANLQLKLVPWRHLLKTYPLWLVGMLLAWLQVRKKQGLSVILGFTWSVLISVDLLIYPNEPNYRVRYFYDIMPLFFLLGATGFDQFWTWVKQKKTSWWARGGILVLLSAALIIPGSTIFPWTVYADQPEWNRVSDLEAEVVIAHPTAPANFYLGHVDYWLVSHKGEIRTYSENNQDIYAGAAILLDPQKLKSILTSSHGVVVLETNRFKFISKDLRQTLKAFAQKDQQRSTELLQVWTF